jgi:hypothetical protein
MTALQSLPRRRRKRILNGVRIMTGHELFFCIRNKQNIFRWGFLREMLAFRRDPMFCDVLLRHYWRRVRDCSLHLLTRGPKELKGGFLNGGGLAAFNLKKLQWDLLTSAWMQCEILTVRWIYAAAK